MLYLIGGTGRTGKSTVARAVISARPMMWTSTDALQWSINKVAPQLGIHTGGDGDDQERAFRPLLRELCLAQTFHEKDSLVEGHVIHPHFAVELRDSNVPVRACFIGLSLIDPGAFLANQGRNDWLLKLDPDSQRAEMASVIVASERVKAEAKECGFPYVDMAERSFDAQVQQALHELGIETT